MPGLTKRGGRRPQPKKALRAIWRRSYRSVEALKLLTGSFGKSRNPFSKGFFAAGGICLFLAILITCFCRIQKEPGPVWNLRYKIVELANRLVGLPYHYGGNELYGFDCSGLVYYVYDCFGIRLPRTAQQQARLKGKISLKEAKPGDIVAFKLKSGWHTAVYIGSKSFIHAPNQHGKIKKETLDSSWKKRLKKVIRVIKD